MGPRPPGARPPPSPRAVAAPPGRGSLRPETVLWSPAGGREAAAGVEWDCFARSSAAPGPRDPAVPPHAPRGPSLRRGTWARGVPFGALADLRRGCTGCGSCRTDLPRPHVFPPQGPLWKDPGERAGETGLTARRVREQVGVAAPVTARPHAACTFGPPSATGGTFLRCHLSDGSQTARALGVNTSSLIRKLRTRTVLGQTSDCKHGL